MKYINKKLPLVDVGKELTLDTNLVNGGVHCFENGQLFCNQSALQKLISEGWIEEVKPREFLLEFDATDCLESIYDNNGKELPIDNRKGIQTYLHKRIKVREVIDEH